MLNTSNSCVPQQDPQPSNTICSSNVRLNSPNPDTWIPLGYTAKDLFNHLSVDEIHQHAQYNILFGRYYKEGILNYHPQARDTAKPRFSIAFVRSLDDFFFAGALMRALTREQFNIQFAKRGSRRWRKQAERENGKDIVDLLKPSKWRRLVSIPGVTVFNNPPQHRFYDESDSVAAEVHIFESDALDLDDGTLDARTRVYIGTILHECLHAFAGLYVCNCCACLGGYNDIVSLDGHGPLFFEMAMKIQQLATKVFGNIDLRLEALLAKELCLLEGLSIRIIDDVIDQHSHIIDRLGMDRTKIKCEMVKKFEKKGTGKLETGVDLGMDESGLDVNVDSDVDGEKEDDVYSDEDEWEGQPRNGFLQYYNRFYGDC